MNLAHFVRCYDGDLDAGLCARMIDSFAGLQRFHQPNGRGVRPELADSAWTEVNVTRLSEPTLQDFFRRRVSAALARYNADIGLAPIPVPDSPKTRTRPLVTAMRANCWRRAFMGTLSPMIV